MPDRLYIVAVASVALILAAFLLVGAHREVAFLVRDRLRRRRRGGFLIGGDH